MACQADAELQRGAVTVLHNITSFRPRTVVVGLGKIAPSRPEHHHGASTDTHSSRVDALLPYACDGRPAGVLG
jgi:hypothetical protein